MSLPPPDEWNKSDVLDFELFSLVNPFDRGHEGLDEVLDVIESFDEELRPGRISFERNRKPKYSRQLMHESLPEFQSMEHTSFFLRCACVPEAYFRIHGSTDDEGSRFSLSLQSIPFAWFREPGKQEERAAGLVAVVRALAARLPLSYGQAHSGTDQGLDKDLDHPGLHPYPPTEVERMYWLNVYGPQLVEALGRERVLSTPAFLVEELPHGAVLVLTHPTPVDFASEKARLAQARALVHLRPDLNLEDVLSTLHRRSLAFTPIPIEFDPDVADILQEEMEFQGLLLQRPFVERYNAYHPPSVSEWLPAAQQPWPDVPDVEAAIDRYEGLHAERLLARLHTEVPSVMDRSPESLPRIDWNAWRMAWGSTMSQEERALVTPALGAYLGMLLVYQLGGKWMPRRNLDEAAVMVGDRAWLPFLRARHHLQGRNGPLDYSLTQFFREARRLRGEE
ncbi:hypothetical protein [Vitiosangium sp. GDMCC 1.1324]|uniref:hypothetical protein n=1 Tax=Vitiosangium sp. (strain GDMCC 1.1324) TaxID=2138576 RepID=UPI000D33E4D6|nr:hypothetical protein [Vitiosangium sp. GDMCC 1.1324]PTL84411.1 hypothetical protein DAT35_04780 [Vitiosangium sp. GDMCC 1.1324]